MKKAATKQQIKAYFNRYTYAAEDKDKKDEQKKLKETFHDERLLLRYNGLINQWQLWYSTPYSLYVIFNAEWPFNIDRIIYKLRQRQKKRRELLAMYEAQQERQEKTFDDKNKELARETAELVRDHKVGKVSTSARTK